MLLAAAAVKACVLLTAADVAAVLGEKPAEVRQSKPRHVDSRCSFTLARTGTSATLEATKGSRAVQFAERLRVAAETEGDEAGENEEPAISPVRGVGDEAWWALGSPASLYVRRGSTLLRLSVGGEESTDAKLEKLRLLAVKALSRLPK